MHCTDLPMSNQVLFLSYNLFLTSGGFLGRWGGGQNWSKTGRLIGKEITWIFTSFTGCKVQLYLSCRILRSLKHIFVDAIYWFQWNWGHTIDGGISDLMLSIPSFLYRILHKRCGINIFLTNINLMYRYVAQCPIPFFIEHISLHINDVQCYV